MGQNSSLPKVHNAEGKKTRKRAEMHALAEMHTRHNVILGGN